MTFPHHLLCPSDGRVFAYLFENSLTGVKRGVYWGATLEFATLEYADEDFDCSMTCEWIPWEIRSWRDLDGRRLSANYGDQGIEASFYMSAHDCAHSVELSLTRKEGSDFHVDLSMDVEFSGWTGEDKNPHMQVAGALTVPFEGVWLRPDSFAKPDAEPVDALAIASDFLVLEDFFVTESDNGALLFQPKT